MRRDWNLNEFYQLNCFIWTNTKKILFNGWHSALIKMRRDRNLNEFYQLNCLIWTNTQRRFCFMGETLHNWKIFVVRHKVNIWISFIWDKEDSIVFICWKKQNKTGEQKQTMPYFNDQNQNSKILIHELFSAQLKEITCETQIWTSFFLRQRRFNCIYWKQRRGK